MYMIVGNKREWNGNGMEMEWKWNGNGMGMEWEWNGNGMGMEWEWNGNGMGMEWEWNGNGMGMAQQQNYQAASLFSRVAYDPTHPDPIPHTSRVFFFASLKDLKSLDDLSST